MKGFYVKMNFRGERGVLPHPKVDKTSRNRFFDLIRKIERHKVVIYSKHDFINGIYKFHVNIALLYQKLYKHFNFEPFYTEKCCIFAPRA